MADSDSNTTESTEAENKTTASIHSADNVGPSVSSNFIENAAADATSTAGGAKSSSDAGTSSNSNNPNISGRGTQQHYVSGLLDDVLEQPRPAADDKRSYKHPMILDVVLAIGLLVAMGGFTIGLMNIYITHQAEQSIMQRNYRAAITVLKGAPLAGFFKSGADPADLLNQALYLDAMERLDANGEDETALRDLEKISPGSRYFDISQDILKEHFKPADRQLEGKAEHVATPAEAEAPKKPILPPAETDATP